MITPRFFIIGLAMHDINVDYGYKRIDCEKIY